MARSEELLRELLEVVPDHPVWIEARAALLDPECRLFGDRSGYVIRSDFLRLAAIGGSASQSLIHEALSDIGGISEAGEWAVVMPEGFTPPATAALSRWNAIDADIFREPRGGLRGISNDPRSEIRLVTPEEGGCLDWLPEPLAGELAEALGRTVLATAWADGRPVAFCHSACETDTLWDVSIHTAQGYRRRGLAAATAGFLAEWMRRRGKKAVWGAHSWNVASRTLARKLGFRPSGRLFLLENRRDGDNM